MIQCKQNYIGQKFNHLTVIKQVDDYVSPNSNHRPRPQFLCQCDCKVDNPNEIIVRLDLLKSGHTASCGCLQLKHTLEMSNNHRKPMENNEYLELNLTDNKHTPFGKCKATNTDDYYYFSMCDYEKIKDYCWYVNIHHHSGYHRLVTCINGVPISMHQVLGMTNADHINRNPLDNRRENLDNSATKIIQSQNRGLQSNNTSGCKGVNWHKQANKWRARIIINHKEINLGLFNHKSEAIKARLLAEMKYFDKRSWQIQLMNKYQLLNQRG